MQISGIIPILLNIIQSQPQNQKQPHTQTLTEQATALLKTQAAATTTSSAPGTRTAAAEQHEPALLPLPLKSPLFPETQFFVFRQLGDPPGTPREKGGKAGIAFSLTTNNLGQLYFALTQHTDSLRVDCHTETAQAADQMAHQSHELEASLAEMGFSKVVFRCHVLDPADPGQTGFTSAGLLDRKI